jgi:hypothetical protein
MIICLIASTTVAWVEREEDRNSRAFSNLISPVTDAMGQLLGRSPGERGSIDQIKGRAKLVKSPSNVPLAPQQRALGKIFDVPPEIDLTQMLAQPVQTDLADAGTAPGLIPSSVSTRPSQTGRNGFPGGFISSAPPPGLPGGSDGPSEGIGGNPGGIGGNPGGIGGLPGGVGDNPGEVGGVPRPPLPVTSAVPESSTWALLIVGFAFCGATMRRRKFAKATQGLA